MSNPEYGAAGSVESNANIQQADFFVREHAWHVFH